MNGKMNYNIEVDDNDLRVIFAALAEIPYRVSAPVIDKIASQTEKEEAPE